MTQSWGATSGGISHHRSPTPNGPLTPKNAKLQPKDRERLKADIERLKEAEPGISNVEVGRRLALRYGISGATVIRYI